jgi:hypothetical protein
LTTEFISGDEIVRRLKLEYQYPREDSARILDAFRPLFDSIMKGRASSHDSLREAANLISKHLRMREVGIGLRGHDRLYRFEILVGERPETELANMELVFRPEDFEESKTYKGSSISRLTMAYLAEDNPYAPREEATYNRPALLKGRRTSPNQTIEGDYFITKIRGLNNDLLGWIEVSGSTTQTLPDARTLRWMEAVASILGLAIISGAVSSKR